MVDTGTLVANVIGSRAAQVYWTDVDLGQEVKGVLDIPVARGVLGR